MKAIRAHAPGGPEQLFYEDAPLPSVGAGEALVEVHASAVTPTEMSWGANWKARDGRPRERPVPGHELAGVVSAVGEGVAEVKVGEAVYALGDFWRDGADAEYVAIRAADLAPKPRTLDFVQAASVPLSGLTAWQALFDHGRLAPGQRVLVHGAAGGVGSFAVQLAHGHGAHVIGTGSPGNADFLRQLGCDEVIDYRAVRFEEAARGCDLVLDTVGGETQERSFACLRKGGTLISIVSPPSQARADELGVKAVFFVVEPSRGELVELARLIDSGRLRPIVAEVLPLERARDAFTRGLSGHTRGKLVLQVRA